MKIAESVPESHLSAAYCDADLVLSVPSTSATLSFTAWNTPGSCNKVKRR